MTNLSARSATQTDVNWIQAATETAYAIYLPVLGYPPVPVTEDYAPRIAGNEVFLFTIDATDCGLVVIETHETWLEIFSIVVLPEFQGSGAGRAILKWVEDRAARLGKAEVRLYTNALMARNIGIYRRAGYVETGRRANPKRPQFTIVDMAKSIEPHRSSREGNLA